MLGKLPEVQNNNCRACPRASDFQILIHDIPFLFIHSWHTKKSAARKRVRSSQEGARRKRRGEKGVCGVSFGPWMTKSNQNWQLFFPFQTFWVTCSRQNPGLEQFKGVAEKGNAYYLSTVCIHRGLMKHSAQPNFQTTPGLSLLQVLNISQSYTVTIKWDND